LPNRRNHDLKPGQTKPTHSGKDLRRALRAERPRAAEGGRQGARRLAQRQELDTPRHELARPGVDVHDRREHRARHDGRLDAQSCLLGHERGAHPAQPGLLAGHRWRVPRPRPRHGARCLPQHRKAVGKHDAQGQHGGDPGPALVGADGKAAQSKRSGQQALGQCRWRQAPTSTTKCG